MRPKVAHDVLVLERAHDRNFAHELVAQRARVAAAGQRCVFGAVGAVEQLLCGLNYRLCVGAVLAKLLYAAMNVASSAASSSGALLATVAQAFSLSSVYCFSSA